MAFTLAGQAAYADPTVVGEVGEDTISVGGEHSDTGATPGQSSSTAGQGNHTAAEGPVFEQRLVPDCAMHRYGGLPEAGDFLCVGAIERCPQNDDPSVEGTYFRMRIYQREVDPATGEPLTPWTLEGVECRGPDSPGDDAPGEQEEPDLWESVVSEWETVQIPEATLLIQPPDGRTLVNFPTIFYTDTGEHEFPVTILGREVVIHAVPTEYLWRHGDGTSQTTTTPGKPYPDEEITHTYAATGEVHARVDVHYRGEFTVDGGPRQPLPGLAEVEGAAEPLDIVEARSRLVAGNGRRVP